MTPRYAAPGACRSAEVGSFALPRLVLQVLDSPFEELHYLHPLQETQLAFSAGVQPRVGVADEYVLWWLHPIVRRAPQVGTLVEWVL